MTNVSALPEQLRKDGLFCVWKYEERDGRQTKMPYNPITGGKAQSNNPSTFAPIDVAEAAQGNYDGMGIGIFNDICAIDIDDCIDDQGRLSELAADAISIMNTYTEYSPSGRGIRILFAASGVSYDKNNYYVNNQKRGLEIYVAGATNKYVTVTGNSLTTGKDIENRGAELQIILDKYMKRQQTKQPRQHQRAFNISNDNELINKAINARNGALFTRLYSIGDWSGYPSQSEADQALCNLLAFWTGGDPDQMERLFRQSGLYRDKCEKHPTYLADTIQKAIADCREVYTGARTSPIDDFKDHALDWDGNSETKQKTIVVNNRFLPSIAAEALTALAADNYPEKLFLRSGELVRLTHVEEKGRNGQQYTRPIIKSINESALRGFLARSAEYVRAKKEGGETVFLPAIPPVELVRDIISQDDLPLPLLRGITQTPILRYDGSMIVKPGFDSATSLFYSPERGFTMPTVPETPTILDVSGALFRLHDIISDFPFDGQASKINAIAAIITPVLRDLIDGPVPLGLIDKPLQGTGASLLADEISVITTGQNAFITTAPSGRDREDEWRKRITALLMDGRPIVAIDNLEEVFVSATLCGLLTSTNWSDRRLGRNDEALNLPHRTCWMATGNNIRLAGDLPRRCYRIRMDANTARPWQRDPKGFKYPNLIQHVKAKRGELLAAIYTLARAWIQAGRPKPEAAPPMGSFEDWRHVIGGILEFAGAKDFLANSAEIYENAEVNEGIEELIAALHLKFGDTPFSTKRISQQISFDFDFQDCLPDWLDPSDRGFTRKLGRVLARKAGVIFTNGYRLEKSGIAHHAQLWKVLSVG